MLNDTERNDFKLLKEKYIEICAYNDLLRAEIKNMQKMIDARQEEIKALNKGIKRLSEQKILEKLQKYNNVVSIIFQWKPDTDYEEGDCVRWSDIDFICTKEHRSKKEFSNKYWRERQC